MEERLSPQPTESQVLLSFPDSIAEVIKGNKVTRIEWNSTDYGVLKDGYLTIYKNGEFFRWLVSDGDLLATDWVVLEAN